MATTAGFKNQLPPWKVVDYRGGKYEYGGPFELKSASGRATCRACGKKIMAGQFALVGYHDFRGSGSYTAQRIWIHESEHDCA
jgi:hypothetical protein